MSQGFKLRFDQMRESDPTNQNSEKDVSDHYSSMGNTRNLCFSWPDGRRMFMNYAYLISCELKIEMSKNIIELVFSSHVVTLHGYGLELLFLSLLDHTPRFITVFEERYVIAQDEKNATVVMINVENVASQKQ